MKISIIVEGTAMSSRVMPDGFFAKTICRSL